MHPRRGDFRRIVAALITLVALGLVAWGALRIASPPVERQRVIVTETPSPPQPQPLEPVQVTVDETSGELTVTARDEDGRLRELRLPVDALAGQIPQRSTAELPSRTNMPEPAQ